MQYFDLVISEGRCFVTTNPNQPRRWVVTDIGLKDGKISKIGNLNLAERSDTFSARGLHIIPGVIDTQVHFREPGSEHKEDLASGSGAAVLGGVTGVFEMPNTQPPTISRSSLADKLRRASGRMRCHYAFYMGASPENISELAELENLPGCCGVKLFMGSSTGSLLVPNEHDLIGVLNSGKRIVAVHAEDQDLLVSRKNLCGHSVTNHPMWRNEEVAFRATRRIVELARKARRRLHILHVTTAQEMEFLAANKDVASVECTPQHLTLIAPDCYLKLGTLAQMNPPIRDQFHQEALWKALHNGTIDIIGSDHAPHTLLEKQNEYPNSPSGMPGVQTLLPIMLNHVHEGRLSLDRLIELVSENPVKIFQIQNKGFLCEGYDADLTIVDLQRSRTIDNNMIFSKCKWTPFHGLSVVGWPVATIVCGQIAMREDEILGSPNGKAYSFCS